MYNKERKKQYDKKRQEEIKKRMDADAEYAEKIRQQYRIRHARRRAKNRDGINKYQRNRYAADRFNESNKQKSRRHKREPNRAIFAATRDLAEGRIGLDEYTSIINEALSWASSITNYQENRKPDEDNS